MIPLYIGPYEKGVEQNLKPFMIPDEAFPNMNNAYVFRGRVERKPGNSLIGRLQRAVSAITLSTNAVGTTYTVADIFNDANMLFVNNSAITTTTIRGSQPNTQLTPKTLSITIGAMTFTDTLGTGVLTVNTGGSSGTVNYITGAISLSFPAILATPVVVSLSYNPTLPAMGLPSRELTTINEEQTVGFDTKYAYRFSASGPWSELPSTMKTFWTGTDTNFFWGTNYQYDSANNDLFWVTNFVPGLHGYAYTLATNANPCVVSVTIPAGQSIQLQANDVVYFLNPNVSNFNFLKTTVRSVAGNNVTLNLDASTFPAGSTSGVLMFQNHIVAGDGIRYYNGSTWLNFNPLTNATNAVETCLMLIPYHQRLIMLNTVEGADPTLALNTAFRQRARWCWIGDSTDVVNGWRDDQSGYGGFADAATEEAIVSCGFVKDQLIVYFERSTWTLVYTGNDIEPFQWRRINSELGSESTFSSVQFDNGLMAMGNVGLHMSNGISTQRIDQDIPDTVFSIFNGSDDSGPKRVCAIRDFLNEVTYFSYSNSQDNTNGAGGKTYYPNQILTANYRNSTFSFFDDNYTCFGYFQRANRLTWADLTETSIYPSWAAWNDPWNSSYVQAQTLNVAAGNQQGFIMQINENLTGNSPSLTITNIVADTDPTNPGGLVITSPQFNLFSYQYVYFSGTLGITNLNGNVFKIYKVTGANTFSISPTYGAFTGSYAGLGSITVMSLLTIQTKMFTPFWKQGKRYTLKYIDMCFDKTQEGELTVDVFVNTSSINSMTKVVPAPSSSTLPVILGNNIISTAPETGINYQFQSDQNVIWKRFYTCVQGDTFQLQLSYSDAEMRSVPINESDVVIHGMIFWFDPAGEFL